MAAVWAAAPAAAAEAAGSRPPTTDHRPPDQQGRAGQCRTRPRGTVAPCLGSGRPVATPVAIAPSTSKRGPAGGAHRGHDAHQRTHGQHDGQRRRGHSEGREALVGQRLDHGPAQEQAQAHADDRAEQRDRERLAPHHGPQLAPRLPDGPQQAELAGPLVTDSDSVLAMPMRAMMMASTSMP